MNKEHAMSITESLSATSKVQELGSANLLKKDQIRLYQLKEVNNYNH